MIQSGIEPDRGVFTEAVNSSGETKVLRVVEGHLFVCKGCCCGNVENGFPEVPIDRFKAEWKARGIRNRIHLTISACLGPCAVANVVLLMYRGRTVWLHSINDEASVIDVYDYVERLLTYGEFSPPAGRLRHKVFQRYASDSVCPAPPSKAVAVTERNSSTAPPRPYR